MNAYLNEILGKAVDNLGIKNPEIKLEYPENPEHGDFSSNIALIYAKGLKMSPKALAEKITAEIQKNAYKNIDSVSIAGPGFINFKIADSFFSNEIVKISKDLENFGKIGTDQNSEQRKKIMVEYTDPNPFKIFHIGHLMANTVGESISRIVEFSGADVIRTCYQGDVGLHVAKTLWAVMKNIDSFPPDSYSLIEKIKFLGDMYVIGSTQYELDGEEGIIIKKEIADINKKIFEKSDAKLNEVYEKGRAWSLEYFDTIYKKLGTKFNHFIFESEVADTGVQMVKEFLKKGIFEISNGATIFPGEKYGTHTRVFINSHGLPTYEAKELGLIAKKMELYPDLSESITITANEQDDYFKVLKAALKEINPLWASKFRHISHGILRPATGKMSSRKGNVVSAEAMIEECEDLIEEKVKDREFGVEEKEEIKEIVAIAGLKFTILRQAIGGDIIYDPEKALSFEGDSGPYLQYSAVRAQAILSKAGNMNDDIKELPKTVELLEKLLVRFPEIIQRIRTEYAPHYLVTYLIELASAFNSYYAHHKIIDEKDLLSPYRINLTKVFIEVMKNGLWILGIKVPKKM